MKGYRTKRISLPGGRVIEIVFFADSETPTKDEHHGLDGLDADHQIRVTEDTLNFCPTCHSDLVYPVAWEESSSDSWRIERRCPNCEWRGVGDFRQAVVENFDDALNDGTEDLLSSLRQFSRANMEADVETLIDALGGGHIEPMDF